MSFRAAQNVAVLTFLVEHESKLSSVVWLRCRTCHRRLHIWCQPLHFRCNPGQVVHTPVPVLPSSDSVAESWIVTVCFWCQLNEVHLDLTAVKRVCFVFVLSSSITGIGRWMVLLGDGSNGSLPLRLWLCSPVGWEWNQLWTLRSYSTMGVPYFTMYIIVELLNYCPVYMSSNHTSFHLEIPNLE